ncbi:MAG: DUF2017 family protein [Ornithinimicrobium sp.]
MAKAFARKRGRITGALDADEIAVVLQLLRLTKDFVAPERDDTGDPLMDLIAGLGESDVPPQEPRDPALLRLLPPAHRTDDAQAAEFRALTEHSVRQRKTRTLSAAIDALCQVEPPKISLDETQAQSLMVALTDVRLVLGERLGLRTDEDAAALHEEMFDALNGGIAEDRDDSEKDDSDADDSDANDLSTDLARMQQMAYYDFLSWLQESIALSLLDT